MSNPTPTPSHITQPTPSPTPSHVSLPMPSPPVPTGSPPTAPLPPRPTPPPPLHLPSFSPTNPLNFNNPTSKIPSPFITSSARSPLYPSPPTPTVLRCVSTQSAIDFLNQSTRNSSSLRNRIFNPSTPTTLPTSTRDILEYAKSRGAGGPLDMQSVNDECVQHGQVWRPAAITVNHKLLGMHSDKQRTVYTATPSILRPHCAIVWRDIYDFHMSCTDSISLSTVVCMAAAGRTAYNWLSNRHRSIISNYTMEYIQATLKSFQEGRPSQYRSCAINALQFCQGYEVARQASTDWKVTRDIAVLLISECLSQQQGQTTDTEVLMDHHNQIATLHVRGYWAGDISIAGHLMRRSEILNFVPHDTMVVAFDEIRTCPCQADRILRNLITIEISRIDVLKANEVLHNPGLVSFAWGRVIFWCYVVLLVAAFATVTELSVTSPESRLDRMTSVLQGWSWSVALVSALHIIVLMNFFPKIELRDLAMGKKHVSTLEEMRLDKGVLICLAHDARANHLLGPGNACAYSNRPSGKVQVGEMPNAIDARDLGLIVSDTFAIKFQQGSPLVRKIVKNLDGSIHVDWDGVVTESVVGRILREDSRIG